MPIYAREDDSFTKGAKDTLNQVQWYATTWFKSSAASVGAVLLILFAGLAIFICRPWRQSRKAEKKLARIRQELLLNAMDDPDHAQFDAASRDTQPLMRGQPNLPTERTLPPPGIPFRPGMGPIQTGLGNTPGMSLTMPAGGSMPSRSQGRRRGPSNSSRGGRMGFRGSTSSEDHNDDGESSSLATMNAQRGGVSGPSVGPKLQMSWGREHSTDAQLTSLYPNSHKPYEQNAGASVGYSARQYAGPSLKQPSRSTFGEV